MFPKQRLRCLRLLETLPWGMSTGGSTIVSTHQSAQCCALINILDFTLDAWNDVAPCHRRAGDCWPCITHLGELVHLGECSLVLRVDGN